MIVYIDSNLVIYFVEGNPVWGAKTVARIGDLRSAGDSIAVSDLTRMECKVGPLMSGNTKVLADFLDFFTTPDVQIVPMSPAVFDCAAEFRATYRFRTPDSQHLAAAIEHGCQLFLTNDAQLASCTDISVEILT